MNPIPFTNDALRTALSTASISQQQKQQILGRIKSLPPNSLISYSLQHITLHAKLKNGNLFKHTWDNY